MTAAPACDTLKATLQGKVMAVERKRNSKYFRWGLTLLSVVLASILFAVVFINLPGFFRALSALTAVLSPLLYGAVFAFLLNPIVVFVDKRLPRLLAKKLKKPEMVKKLSRVTGIVIALTFGGVMVYGLLYLLLPQLYDSILSIVGNLSSYFSTLEAWVLGLLEDNPELRGTVENALESLYAYVQNWLSQDFLSDLQKLMTGLTSSVMLVLRELMNIIIGVVASVYILWSKDTFRAQAKKLTVCLFRPERADRILYIGRRTHRIFNGFVVGKIIDSLIIGVLCYIGMLILRLPYPMLIATVVGVTNIIPFFGPFIGAIPSAVLILLVSPLQCVYFLLFILALQQLDGNVIGPRILGDSTGISGFWVLVSITVAGNLFGFAGMLLGVPVFAVCYTLLKEWMTATLQKKAHPADTEAYLEIDCVDDLKKPEEGEQLSFDPEEPETPEQP